MSKERTALERWHYVYHKMVDLSVHLVLAIVVVVALSMALRTLPSGSLNLTSAELEDEDEAAATLGRNSTGMLKKEEACTVNTLFLTPR